MLHKYYRKLESRLRRSWVKTPFYSLEQAPLYWIDSPAKLTKAIERMLPDKAIGIDTETNNLYAYQEKVCLLQISTWDEDFIIDPLAFADKSALYMLNELTSHYDIVKIFQGADYDVGGLQRDFGLEFHRIFDTYLSARYLRYDGLGLQYLVNHHFGIMLDKSLTKFNWGKRPIPPAELDYARSDVRYLVPLYWRLKGELKSKGILADAMVDFERLSEKKISLKQFDANDYTKIKGAQELSPEQKRKLRELYVFREKKAQKWNRPPFKVLNERTLINLAQLDSGPQLNERVRTTKGLPGHRREEITKGIVQCLERAEEKSPIKELPHSRNKKSKKKTGQQVYFSRRRANDNLKAWRNEKANGEIDPQAVLPNYVLDKILTLAPETEEELAHIPFFGPKRLQKYGSEVLAILEDCRIQD